MGDGSTTSIHTRIGKGKGEAAQFALRKDFSYCETGEGHPMFFKPLNCFNVSFISHRLKSTL
jgi:hypothetical protein